MAWMVWQVDKLIHKEERANKPLELLVIVGMNGIF